MIAFTKATIEANQSFASNSDFQRNPADSCGNKGKAFAARFYCHLISIKNECKMIYLRASSIRSHKWRWEWMQAAVVMWCARHPNNGTVFKSDAFRMAKYADTNDLHQFGAAGLCVARLSLSIFSCVCGVRSQESFHVLGLSGCAYQSRWLDGCVWSSNYGIIIKRRSSTAITT